MERDGNKRGRGCFLGLAAGDALGTTIEFDPPGTFTPIENMAGGGPYGLQPGQWTDDTSMALCLAESLIECNGFDPHDQMERYLRWYRHGYLSSTGHCFDIGNTVRQALHRFEIGGEPFSGSTDPYSAGNGSLMRLAPIPIYYHNNPEQAIHYAAESSRTTHGAPAALDACRYFAGLLLGALNGLSKSRLLGRRYCPLEGYWDVHPLVPEINEISLGSFKTRQPPEIQGSGYVVRSLEAALWAFYHSSTFKEGCLLAVNLGDDADTTGAIYGQLAGAYYGVDAIPAQWLELLALRDLIEDYTERLVAQS